MRDTERMSKGHPVRENMHNHWNKVKLGTKITSVRGNILNTLLDVTCALAGVNVCVCPAEN